MGNVNDYTGNTSKILASSSRIDSWNMGVKSDYSYQSIPYQTKSLIIGNESPIQEDLDIDILKKIDDSNYKKVLTSSAK